MILAFLLGAAEPDPEFDRLFGPEPASAVVEGLPESALPWWSPAAAVLALGVGAMTWMYRRGNAPAPGVLSVLVRQSLGDRGALVLIEVTGGDGERRRLLIGTGGGPPTLVADLGASFEVPEPVVVPEPSRVVAPAPPRPPPLRSVAPASNIAEEVLRDRMARPGRLWAVVGEEE